MLPTFPIRIYPSIYQVWRGNRPIPEFVVAKSEPERERARRTAPCSLDSGVAGAQQPPGGVLKVGNKIAVPVTRDGSGRGGIQSGGARGAMSVHLTLLRLRLHLLLGELGSTELNSTRSPSQAITVRIAVVGREALQIPPPKYALATPSSASISLFLFSFF